MLQYSPIVSILANSETGLVAVAQADGTIQTYFPLPTSPWPDDEDTTRAPVTSLGRYLWRDGPLVRCYTLFRRQDEKQILIRNRSNASKTESVDLSSSSDNKLLVAYRNQLAVFDVASGPIKFPTSPLQSKVEDATLVWTAHLEAEIVAAKFSGDGQAVAVIVNGEGVDNENPFGVRTFLRDEDDGSDIPAPLSDASVPPAPLERTKSVGVIYRPGPFLVHTAPVTRISFRGLGHVTSNVLSSPDEGNDLLLTYCNEDCSVRVFNQNGWKQLMHWTTPPNSRADWDRGLSAFTLGDLDSPKVKSKATSAAPSRRNSIGESDEPPVPPIGGAEKAPLVGNRSFQGLPSHPTPSSAAGAWISELTFRNAFPALRLSRLSYMKRGEDDVQPAHFESVAAILPAGSIVAGGVLNSDDLGLTVQGIWPSWDPCFVEGTTSESGDAVNKSSAALLGFPSSPRVMSGGYFGDSLYGGTHSPPSELRIVASHPLTGKFLIMEFPLWGDREFGAMELGSPLRYFLSLSDLGSISFNTAPESTEPKVDSHNTPTVPVASVEYESSRLCAQIEPSESTISITWRRHGGIAALPATGLNHDFFEKNEHHYNAFPPTAPKHLQDITSISVPLSLPQLRLPRMTQSSSKPSIVAVCLWSDENFGGPPLLLVVTSSGAILVYEIPPPWSALEPCMPSYDPCLTEGSVIGGGDGTSITGGSDEDIEEDGSHPKEYDIAVTPDPDFGLGLRLESYEDGAPAVVGAFKKHPLNGGRLPAEKSGAISLGDELLVVNGVNLKGMTFDQVINTVRQVGAEAGPGVALNLRFR